MHKVLIAGASGFAGAELMKLCATHPDLEVIGVTANASAGVPVASMYPHLSRLYADISFTAFDLELAGEADLVFLALPHGESQSLMPALLERVKRVIDLSGDFRLDDAGIYQQWYGSTHGEPTLLDDFALGIPELFRDRLSGVGTIASAGCYVTAASLALAPLLARGMADAAMVVVDAASGVSGAGKSPKDETSFATVDGNFTAYGLLDHRHTPEIELALSTFSGKEAKVLFTPHLAPMTRGILATCYTRTVDGASTNDALETLAMAYAGEPFIEITESVPGTKDTLGSNNVHITARVDARTGWTVTIAALDNLVKGAAGQAVQCANLALGIEETTGLGSPGIYP